MAFENLLVLTLFSIGGGIFLLERVPLFQRKRIKRNGRWTTNLGLLVIGSIVLALCFPVGPYAVAEMQPHGFLSSMEITLGGQFVLVFLLLDLWRYWEHRIFHKVSLLWRAHLVHHSDTFIDVTTAERHHPLEALITTPLALMLVFVLGLPAEGVGIYLLAAIASSLWVHSNLRFPSVFDSTLRILIVTPAVHAIHHSSTQQQTDSNYGSILTVWDRLFGTYIDPANVHIPYFGLEYFHKNRDTTLLRTLLQPVLYRKNMPCSVREIQPELPTPVKTTALSYEWQQALLYGGMGLVLAALAMWPTFASLVSLWSSSEPYQYAWLVLPFLIYALGWHYRDALLALSPQADPLGIAVTAGAVILWLIAAVVQINLGMYIAFVLVLQGILISVVGRHIWWRLFPLFALLFFMIPSGDVLQLPLRILTVMTIDWFANITNLPHSIDGFVIYIGDNRYVVIEACSGLTFVMLAMFLAYSWGTLLYHSMSKVLGLALLGGLLGIAANVLRVNMIIWLDWINGTQMSLAEHSDMQLIALIFLLGALFLTVYRLQPEDKTVNRHCGGKPQLSGQNMKGYVPVVSGLLVACTIGLVQLILNVSEAESPSSRAELAFVSTDNFSTAQSNINWIVDEKSKTGTLNLVLDSELEVMIVQALPGNKKLSESGLIPKGNHDWREANIASRLACLQENCINFMHTTWNRSGSDDVQHIFYAYHVGNYITDSKLIYRVATGWNRLTGADQKAGLISFFFAGKPPALEKLVDAYMQIQTAHRQNNWDKWLIESRDI